MQRFLKGLMLLTAVSEVQWHAGRFREGQQFWKH